VIDRPRVASGQTKPETVNEIGEGEGAILKVPVRVPFRPVVAHAGRINSQLIA
jgi:hypothetical protein